MGCQSSKSASQPVRVPSATLLTSRKVHEKSPKAAPAPELPIESVEVTIPTAEQPQLKEEAAVEKEPMSTAAVGVEEDKPTFSRQFTTAESQEHVETFLQDLGFLQATEELPAAEGVGDSQAKQPTSRVHKNPQGWQEEGILFAREGIRFLMQEFSDAVRSMDPLPAWKWENLSIWYQDYFYTVVHDLHDAEEKVYLPWIQAHMAVPDKISADLMRAMEDLSTMLKIGATIPSTERAKHLEEVKQFLDVFIEDMQQHLSDEEDIIPRLLRDGGFTQEEEAPIVGKIIECLDKKALPPMLYAYTSWAGPEKAAALVSPHLPMPIQSLYSNFWIQDFRCRHQGLLSSIGEGVDTNPFAFDRDC